MELRAPNALRESRAAGSLRTACEALKRRASAATLADSIGFFLMTASSFLYENYVVLNDVASLNFTQYVNMAQVLTLVIGAIAALAAHWMPSATFVRICAAAAVVGALPHFANLGEMPSIAGSALFGVATGVLMLAWGLRLVQLPTRKIFAMVFASFFASTLLCVACSFAPSSAGIAVSVALPLGSALLYRTPASPKPNGARHQETLVSRQFIATLVCCCLISAFFAGMTISPYCFQADPVSHFLYLFDLLAFPLLFALSQLQLRPQVQPYLIVAIVLLIVGLLLFSSGSLGSPIVPLAIILAAKSCCIALAWVALALMAHPNGPHPVALFGFGLAIANGTLGRSVGIFVYSQRWLGYADMALAASVAIGAFALFYVITATMRPHALPSSESAAAQPSEPDAEKHAANKAAEKPRPMPKTTEDLLKMYCLSGQEMRVARVIIEGLTYNEISERLSITERTVKYHAKKAFNKAGVENRRDFELVVAKPEMAVRVFEEAQAKAAEEAALAAAAAEQEAAEEAARLEAEQAEVNADPKGLASRIPFLFRR